MTTHAQPTVRRQQGHALNARSSTPHARRRPLRLKQRRCAARSAPKPPPLPQRRTPPSRPRPPQPPPPPRAPGPRTPPQGAAAPAATCCTPPADLACPAAPAARLLRRPQPPHHRAALRRTVERVGLGIPSQRRAHIHRSRRRNVAPPGGPAAAAFPAVVACACRGSGLHVWNKFPGGAAEWGDQWRRQHRLPRCRLVLPAERAPRERQVGAAAHLAHRRVCLGPRRVRRLAQRGRSRASATAAAGAAAAAGGDQRRWRRAAVAVWGARGRARGGGAGRGGQGALGGGGTAALLCAGARHRNVLSSPKQSCLR